MKLKMKATGLVAASLLTTACIDDQSNDQTALIQHLDYADIATLQAHDDKLLATTTNGYLYQLSTDTGEWQVIHSSGGSGHFLLISGIDHYMMVRRNGSVASESFDAGANWQVRRTDSGADALSYTAMLLIDDKIYARTRKGIYRSHLNENTFNFEKVYGPEEYINWNNEPGENALFYNQVHHELWWNQLATSYQDPTPFVRRTETESQETDSISGLNSEQFADGFADYNDPNLIVVGGEGGVYASFDNGLDWQLVYPQDDSTVMVHSVQQDRQNNNYYAFARTEEDEGYKNEIWCSSDQGSTWNRTEILNDLISASDSMVFITHDDERKFFIPTRRGIFEGLLSSIGCN